MQIVVHDNKMRKVALLNNRFSKMLSFHSDAWHRYLIQATSTFDFSIPKMYNGRLHEDLGFINDKAYFSFKFQGKHHLFYVANITEDDFNITLKCNNTNLGLVNEQANPFTSNSAQTIEWYLQHMDLLSLASLEIGINEISDNKRTLTFESQESKLSRLQSLMSRFNAEFEFVTELNNNGTLKRIVLNIYREADNEHHGIGKVRNDVVLRYGKDVKGVQITTDKTQLFNAGEFTGADGLTLKDIERSDKDAKGREEFYTRKGNTMIYAPISMESYPASMKSGDNWTRKDFQTEYTNVNDLAAYAFRTIKQYAYPIVTYTASIQSIFLNDYQDSVLGDTVKIYDKNFVGGLILQARVIEQVISFSNPNNSTLTFSNYVKLDSKISDTLRKRMAELIEERLPYTLKMSASAGTSFKNGAGESIVTPELYKGQKKITDATYRYYFGQEMTTGATYKVLASKITNTQVLTIAAYVGNEEVTRDKLTFVNVNDGRNGSNGERGEDGKSLRLFTTQYKYAQSAINTYSADGYTGDWSVVENTTGLKVGDSVQMRVFNTDKSSDSWIIVSVINVNNDHSIKALSKGVIENGDKGARGPQGERGLQGIQGLQGPKGEQGIPGIKGADGRTQYTHIAYADDANGTGFSQTDQHKTYIGMYQDFIVADSKNPADYRWNKWRGDDGEQGIPGKPGEDGKTPYIHFAYADDANGTGFSRTDKNQQYYGYYSDYTEDDSTDYKKYKWVDRLANVQVGGRNLLKNSVGPFKPDRKPTANYDNLEYYTKSIIDMVNGKQYILTAETDGVITNLHDGSTNNNNVVIWLASLDYKIHSIISDENTDKKGTVFTWTYPTGTYMLRVNTYKKVSDKSVWKIKIAEGNTKTGWSPAPEDVQDNIDSKADNGLTQEQLNKLNEKNNLMQAELEAKASLDTVNQWFKAYQDFVKSNAVDKAKSEKDLIAATQRVAKIENNLGDMAQRWNFIDTYMQATNEGLSIGKKDGSSFVRMGDNRISFYSAGKEVAYFSGGALQVDNGVFTKTLQIGRFREEQYHLNPDMNVIRYVGGF